MNILRTSLVVAAVSLALTGCNSGGESVQHDFTATAIDGYLKNAKITAECTVPGTGNELKTFEATTNEKGKAGFITNGIPAENCKISVTTLKGTVDMETGKVYQQDELQLTAPKGHLIASPFTTLADNKNQDSGGAIDVPSAIQEVAQEVGIDPELVSSDYVEASSDHRKTPEEQTAARKASLKAVALTMVLPLDLSDYALPVTKGEIVRAVVAEVERVITDAENQGIDPDDLRIVDLSISQAADGTLEVIIATEVVPEDDGTGGTGTGSGSGADGSYMGTGA